MDRTYPHFVKSDDRIYLYSASKGLVSIRWDGSDEKQHAKDYRNYNLWFAFTERIIVCWLNQQANQNENPSTAVVIKMAPEGDKAFAQINNEIYVVTIPKTGGEAPKISVADVDKAQFPATKLTKLGGEFPSWSNDAKTVYYSLGNAFFCLQPGRSKAGLNWN